MKKAIIVVAALLGIMPVMNSCTEKNYSIETKVEIVNNSSSRLSGTVFMDAQTFDLAPGESYSYSEFHQSKVESPDASSVSVMGPRELTVDGKNYRVKDSIEKDFFGLYGWDVTPLGNGFLIKIKFTDEGLANLLLNADLVN